MCLTVSEAMVICMRESNLGTDGRTRFFIMMREIWPTEGVFYSETEWILAIWLRHQITHCERRV